MMNDASIRRRAVYQGALLEDVLAIAGADRNAVELRRGRSTTMRRPFRFPSSSGGDAGDLSGELVARDLLDARAREVARWMGVELTTIYTYRSRIRRKLDSLPPAARPEWAEVWGQRFPGR